MQKNTLSRVLSIGAGVALLCGVAGAAVADTEQQAENNVDVNVEIPEIEEPGVLAMTVAGTSTTLEENGSTELVRTFTGKLPTVTVTDTRKADEIAPDAAWYVLGTSSDFTQVDGTETIGADHLGWTPKLLDGGDSGLVAEGPEVDTALDEGDAAVGLVDQELLAMAFDSAEVNPEGQWTANADLTLKTEATVEPGTYKAKLTLSLFE